MEFKKCNKCKLHKIRRNILPGIGEIPAKILFIGESPGKVEDLTGDLLSDKPGKLFKKMLIDAVKLIKIERNINIKIPSYYYLNTVFCFPSNEISGEKREPENEEVEACKGNIKKLLPHIKQEKTVFAGKFAEKKYKKIFPDAEKIQDLKIILESDGLKSPYYLSNIRKLSEIFYLLERGLQNEKS